MAQGVYIDPSLSPRFRGCHSFSDAIWLTAPLFSHNVLTQVSLLVTLINSTIYSYLGTEIVSFSGLTKAMKHFNKQHSILRELLCVGLPFGNAGLSAFTAAAFWGSREWAVLPVIKQSCLFPVIHEKALDSLQVNPLDREKNLRVG